MFSQPISLDAPNAEPAPPASLSTLISQAAQLGRLLGNPESIKSQLTPDLHASFDLAYEVQSFRDGVEESSAVDRRTEDFVRDATAKRKAIDVVARREREALFSAAELPGDELETLESDDLDNLEEAEMLIDGYLTKESIVRLYGPPKHFKSFVMLDMAGCVGAGIPWCGKKTVKSKVLYIVAEGATGIRRRVRAWEALNKRTMVGVHFYPRAVQLGGDNRKDVPSLIRTAKRGGYAFIILDTQARCTVGVEENSASEMGVVVAALDVLKEVTGACVALVHHSGAAGGRARGSTAILGALDAEFEVKAKKQNMTVELITKAQKDLAEAPDIEMDLVTPGPGLALAVKARPAGTWYQATIADRAALAASEMMALRVVASFFDGAPLTMIASDLDINKGTVYKTLDGLHRKGCIMRQGSTYKIQDLGQRYIEADNRE